jgi:hypothetical protein
LVPSTLFVTTTSDNVAGSLRAEIAAASKGDTIMFNSNLAGQTIALTSGQLEINKNLTIQGLGEGQLAVSGGGNSRVFHIDSGVNATISGLTIEDGKVKSPSVAQGGGILDQGTLTLTGVNLTGNSAVGSPGSGGGGTGGTAQGGGLYASAGAGLLTLTDVGFENDAVIGGAGGAGSGSHTEGGPGVTPRAAGCTWPSMGRSRPAT